MTEQKAIYYGQAELIPGIVCDGYVLDDGQLTTVMSERGAADLLGVDQKLLNRVRTNWPPKSLAAFIDKDLSVRTNLSLKSSESIPNKVLSMVTELVEVTANNSPHKGRKIAVYTSATIENLISAYALALAHRALRENQRHIGERCVILLKALVRTALDAAIKEACGLHPEIQKTVRKNYVDAVAFVKELGLRCSAGNGMATKKDILEFLKVPESTLNSFLRKYARDIEPVALDKKAIQDMGCKAARMNGYSLENAVKIILGMDSEIGVRIKRSLLGEAAILFRNTSKDEIQWREIFGRVFQDLGLHHNYKIGPYKVDFFVEALNLCLDTNRAN